MHDLPRAPYLLAFSLLLGCTQPVATSDREAATPVIDAPPKVERAAAPSMHAEPPTSAPAPEPFTADRRTANAPSVELDPATAELLRSLTADSTHAKAITPEQLIFVMRKDEIWISDGRRAAPMRLHADSIEATTAQTAADGSAELVLEYTDVIRCDGPSHRRTYPIDVLRSRIEGTAAYKRHQAKAYDEAARGFALAAQLDPTPQKRWTNLACALSLRGEVDKAVLALTPLLHREPLVAYSKVHDDPELQALRARPEVTRLRAATPGSALLSLRADKLQGFAFATSTSTATVARLERSESGGTCQFAVNLSFYSSETGEERLSLPLIHLGETLVECGRDADGAPAAIARKHVPTVQRRVDHANTLLRDLGFATAPELDRVVLHGDDEVALPTSKLRLELGDETVRVLRGETALTTVPRRGYAWIGAAGYDPLAKVAFLEWGNDLPEGCSSELQPAGTQVIPVGGDHPSP